MTIELSRRKNLIDYLIDVEFAEFKPDESVIHRKLHRKLHRMMSSRCCALRRLEFYEEFDHLFGVIGIF